MNIDKKSLIFLIRQNHQMDLKKQISQIKDINPIIVHI